MIGSIQMICGMGFGISLAQLIFGKERIKAFWMMLACAAVWWLLACVYGGATPE